MSIVFRGSLDNPKSIGTNKLIKDGAKIVTDPEDIVINYKFLHKLGSKDDSLKLYENNIEEVEEEYKDIYSVITKDGVDLNDIVKQSNLTLNEVVSKLTMLELDGKIKKIAGNRYIRLKL